MGLVEIKQVKKVEDDWGMKGWSLVFCVRKICFQLFRWFSDVINICTVRQDG